MVTVTPSSVSAERGPQVDLKAAFPLRLYAFAAAVVQLLSHV